MESSNARLGEIIALSEEQTPFATRSTSLLSTPHLEVVRLEVRAEEEIPTHRTSGDSTLLCISGSVFAYAWNRTRKLKSGELLFLPRGGLYAVSGISDSILLLTTQLDIAQPRSPRPDRVQEASEDSFPASDAPSWTPVIGP